MYQDWLTNRYHAPSDDLDQPVDLAAAGKYEEIIRQLLIKVANDAERPQWKADSFFRRYRASHEGVRKLPWRVQAAAFTGRDMRHALSIRRDTLRYRDASSAR